jgi:formylglycine-generating enzyme required for sulfatase activity
MKNLVFVSLLLFAMAKNAHCGTNALPNELHIDLGGSIQLDMVLIPAGEFLMGNPDTEADKASRWRERRALTGTTEWTEKDDSGPERPTHRVRITKPFYLGRMKVTEAQWQAMMGKYPDSKGPNFPVEHATWFDCQQFLERLNRLPIKAAGKFQLPSEAQWEYACRAGSTTLYCYGDDEARLGEIAWYQGNSGYKSHPVGEKKPNAWGLYDMHGSVYEWCQDWWDPRYYSASPTIDPIGPAKGALRVERGGSQYAGAVICRSASRHYGNPVKERAGFRVALSIGN